MRVFVDGLNTLLLFSEGSSHPHQIYDKGFSLVIKTSQNNENNVGLLTLKTSKCISARRCTTSLQSQVAETFTVF